MRSLSLLTATALLTSAGVAQAHPKLLSASPAANATVSAPARVELHFSETLMPQFSKGDLMMAGVKAGAPMKLASKATVAPDGRTLVLTPMGAFRPGRYSVAWRVVSTDTHRAGGTFAFAVK